MSPIITLGILYSFMLGGIGFLLIAFSRSAPKLWPWSALPVLGGVHVALGIIMFIASLVTVNDYGLMIECTWLPNTSTVAGSVSSYTWVNSCASTTVPAFFDSLTTFMLYLLMLEGLAVLLWAFVAAVNWVRERVA